MPTMTSAPDSPGVPQATGRVRRDRSDSTLMRVGMRAWAVVGIGLAALLITALLAQISGLVIPLIIASVVGALLVPAVEGLARIGVPRGIGAGAVLVALFLILVGSLWIVVSGLVDQSGEIAAQLTAGLARVADALVEWGVDLGTVDELWDQLTELFAGSTSGLSSILSGTLSSVASFTIGSFVATFLLFYVLVDWRSLSGWVGANLGLEPTVGRGVVNDAVSSVRQYFGGLTISALVTSVLIGITAILLDVPLAFAIALVTLVTSYVPYLGAILSGAFATLIALGSQGPGAALIMLAVILVVQNVVQTLVLTRLTSSSLRIHPIVNFGSTIVGAALLGILGATLSAPLVAMGIRVRARLRAEADSTAPGPTGAADSPQDPSAAAAGPAPGTDPVQASDPSSEA
jgi:predicted PurR-regulated permease PerM